MEQRSIISIKDGKKYFYRFTLNQRIQHIILASAVVTLVLTGMPLKFHGTFWAPYLYALFGGIKAAPVVHKVAGSILLLLFIYHVVYVCYLIYMYQIVPLRRERKLTVGNLLKIFAGLPLIPNLKDARDIRDLMKYLFFLTNKRPDGSRFTWKEKFDYWAPFWGMVIIGLSGLVLWNEEIATHLLPGEIINFSLIAHSDEALLAALFLFIWHWYNVHFSMSVFPMGTAFITGYLPEELMVEEHYDYYLDCMKQSGLEHEILPPHEVHAESSHEEGEA